MGMWGIGFLDTVWVEECDCERGEEVGVGAIYVGWAAGSERVGPGRRRNYLMRGRLRRGGVGAGLGMQAVVAVVVVAGAVGEDDWEIQGCEGVKYPVWLGMWCLVVWEVMVGEQRVVVLPVVAVGRCFVGVDFR